MPSETAVSVFITRWLRPDYQKPLFAGEKQSTLALTETVGGGSSPDSSRRKSGHKAHPTKKPGKAPWPASLADRVRAVELALATEEKPVTAAGLAKRFSRAKEPDIAEILQTLVTLGRARPGDAEGTFVRNTTPPAMSFDRLSPLQGPAPATQKETS